MQVMTCPSESVMKRCSWTGDVQRILSPTRLAVPMLVAYALRRDSVIACFVDFSLPSQQLGLKLEVRVDLGVVCAERLGIDRFCPVQRVYRRSHAAVIGESASKLAK